MQQIDWEKHFKQYEKSGFSMREYCKNNDLNFRAFKTARYRSSKAQQRPIPDRQNAEEIKAFQKFKLGINLNISIDEDGKLSIHDIAAEHLPVILRNLHALS